VSRGPEEHKSSRDHSPFFYLSRAGLENNEVSIQGADARHLSVVRRARPGDRIAVCDGAGTIAEVRLTGAGRDRVEGEVVARSFYEKPSPRVVVMQGLARRAKVDLVVQKLVELGIDEVAVFETGRSVPGWRGEKGSKALERWMAIAGEAAKQSHRAWLPEISGPLPMDEATARVRRAGAAVIADPTAEASFGAVLGPADFQESKEIVVVVGPEGGLSAGEVDLLVSAGGRPGSLGPQVLRTETAAIAAAALALHRFGRLG
jgi:16S rRNA (uracil1498-N3)-methyltransferase